MVEKDFQINKVDNQEGICVIKMIYLNNFLNLFLTKSIHQYSTYVVYSSSKQKVYTGTGRKNETEIILVVEFQINWDISNLVSNTQAVYNYKQLAYTQ